MVGYQYPALINEYFEGRKTFKHPHPETGKLVDWTIHSLDFVFDAGEIETKFFHEDKEAGIAGGGTFRQAVSLSKLLAILENQS